MAGTMSIGGLISGLQTSDIISKIMEIARRPQTQLKADKTGAQLRLSIWQDLNTRILALKTAVDTIAVPGAFANCQANSSDLTVLQATAGTGAVPGTYYLTVKSRAQSHQIAALCPGSPAEPFSSATAEIGTGNVTFNFADDPTKSFTVSIDGTNNTLTGLRDAINRANKSVRVSVINTGTASTPAYQLVLSSTTTGQASQFTVSADPTILVDFSTVIQQGTDAEIQLGGGEGATPITVKKDTNTITDLIPGVTLSVMNPAADKTIKLEIVRGTNVIKDSIQRFVQQYNDLSDAIAAQFKYDAAGGTSGALMGNWDLQTVQSTLSSVIGGTVQGVNKRFSALATIGITQDTQGHLQIDDATLTNALNNNLADVSRLFAADLTSDSTYITYLSSSSSTQPSPTTGWNVVITQAARQAQITAAVPMTGTLDTDETLTIYSDPSKAASTTPISLSSGWTLSRVIAEINAYSDRTGVAAVATTSDGTVSSDPDENTYLTLRSVRYGSTANIYAFSNVSNSSGSTSGLGKKLVTVSDPSGESGTGVALAGLDVAGTINGEACKGTGQMLTTSPADSNSAVKGLSLLVTATAPMSTKVYFTKGIATLLRDTLVSMTSLTGIVTAAQDSINTEISDLDKRIADMEERLKTQEEKLWKQFNNLESQLAKLQDQGAYLTRQIEALTYNKR